MNDIMPQAVKMHWAGSLYSVVCKEGYLVACGFGLLFVQDIKTKEYE
jgi:hypothetical protein